MMRVLATLVLAGHAWFQIAAGIFTGGDVDVVVMDQSTNPEWSATCSSDFTYPDTHGFCNTLEGPGGPNSGQHLKLGLQYALSMATVNENQVILCNAASESPARAICRVLLRRGNFLEESNSGSIPLVQATTTDIDIAEMEKSRRYLACYIYDAGSSKFLLQCALLSLAGSSLNHGNSTITIAGNGTDAQNSPNAVQVIPMHTDTALVCYSGKHYAATCTLVRWEQGSLVSGSPLVIQQSQVRNLVGTKIFDQRAVVCYASGSTWKEEMCTVIQSTTGSSMLNQGSDFVVSNTRVLGAADMTALAAQQAGLCYVAVGHSSVICHSLTASGLTLSKGNDQTFDAQDDSRVAIRGLTSDRALLCVKSPNLASECQETSGLLSGVSPDGSTSLGVTITTTVATTTAASGGNSHNIVIVAGNSGGSAPAPAQITNVNTAQSQSQSSSSSSNNNGRRRGGSRRRRRRRDKSTTTTDMPWGIPWWGWFLIVNIPILIFCMLCWSAAVGGWCKYSTGKKKQAKAGGGSSSKGKDPASDKKALLDERDKEYYGYSNAAYNSRRVKRYDDYSSSSSSGSYSSDYSFSPRGPSRGGRRY